MNIFRIFVIGFLVSALFACGDKTTENNQSNINPDLQLSENSSVEEIVQALSGTWENCGSNQEKGTSLKVTFITNPDIKSKTINASKTILVGYDKINCQGNIIGTQELDNSGTTIQIISYKKRTATNSRYG